MKFKLGKRQVKIFTLVGLSSTAFYYADKYRLMGGNFSDGILVGFLYGLVAVFSLATIYLWLEMLYLNFIVRMK